jgi:hypothetical protein
MLNFTEGPVMSSDAVREIGGEQVPYFRTPEFSEIMLENERLIKKFSKAEEQAKVLFITGSGTASMEATVMNVFTANDKVLIINGGSFGHRFVELCKIHEIPYDEINPAFGEDISEELLSPFDGKGGRVTKEDVEAFIKNLGKAPVAAPTAATPVAAAPVAPLAGRTEKRVPMTRLRKRIAERLLEAKNTTAMLTTFNEINTGTMPMGGILNTGTIQ